jgi:hypothetical protein
MFVDDTSNQVRIDIRHNLDVRRWHRDHSPPPTSSSQPSTLDLLGCQWKRGDTVDVLHPGGAGTFRQTGNWHIKSRESSFRTLPCRQFSVVTPAIWWAAASAASATEVSRWVIACSDRPALMSSADSRIRSSTPPAPMPTRSQGMSTSGADGLVEPNQCPATTIRRVP